jgi:hypothetical protein
VYTTTSSPRPEDRVCTGRQAGMTRAEVGIFFRDLRSLLGQVPIRRASAWMDTCAFTEGGAAPTGRHGDIGKLTTALCARGQERNS